jgi:peptide/nickel transport system substrate-binding protein
MPMVSDDGLEYVFDIRQDVQFHSGSQLTAHDVAYSWSYFLDPDNDLKNAGRFLGTVEPEVEAEDDSTVRFHLAEPWSPWVTFGYDWHGLVEENSREEHDNWEFPDGPGSGPGVPADYSPQDFWAFEANEDYWHEDIPQWNEYRIEIVPSATNRTVRLQENEVDLEIGHSPEDHATLQETDGVTVDSQPQTLGMAAFYVKCSYQADREGETSPFENIHNRKAIQYSIPRQAIAEELFNGLLSPTGAFCSPEAWFHSEEMEMYEHNPDKVREHLEKAGNPDGFEFRFVSQQNSPYSDVATLMQSEWEQYGIETTLEQQERGSVFGQITSDGWDLACVFSQLAPEPDEMNLWMSRDGPYTTSGGSSFFGWMPLHPDEADRTTELIERGRQAATQEERKPAYVEMGKILADISPMIFIGSAHTAVGHRDNMTNVRAPNDGVLRHKTYGKQI